MKRVKFIMLLMAVFAGLRLQANSEGNYVKSKLFDDLGPREKGAILVVHFGTSFEDTRKMTIDVINAKIKESFPEVEVREAWTSRMIVRKLKKEKGIMKQNPTEALMKLHEEGYTHILVQSTNIVEGKEMKELRREVESLQLNFKDIRIGNPLLYAPDDYVRVIKALTESVNKEVKGGQKILVGHGTADPATASYAMFDYMLKAEGYGNYHVGTIEGYPTLNDVLCLLKKGTSRVVTLVPMMFVAGDHARNDMADEWKNKLERQGYQVKLYMKGLGENPEIQNLFVEHARFVADHKLEDLAAKKQLIMVR